MASELPPDSEEIPPPPTRPEGDAESTTATSSREPLLRRSAADRYLAGVAGGLGERLQLDPLVVRLGLVGAAMFGAYAGPDLHPFVLIPYFLAWMIVPPAQGRSLISRIRERQALQEIAGAGVLLVIGLLVLADTRYAFAIGLAAAAIALLSDRRPGSEVADESAPPPSAGSSSGAVPGQSSTTDPTPNLDPTTEVPPPLMRGRNFNIGERAAGLFGPRPQRPSRREPALWPLTLSLIVLLAIVGILIDTFTEPGMDPGVAVNLALLAIGSVLMLSFWRGRARITILWALALVPLWIGFSVANVGRFPGEGTARHMLTQADLSGDLIYQQGYGELYVDLQHVQLAQGSETTMAVDLTAGTARVLVPRDVKIQIKGKVGLGNFSVRNPMYSIAGATLANGTINRSFQALGSDCFSQELAEADIAQYASSIGLVIDEGQAVGDAMVAAGYERPQFEFTNAVEEWYVDEEGLESTRLVETDYYTVQTDRQGFLCTPEPPPENPATLIIEPTIGIGTLEIQRVDIP